MDEYAKILLEGISYTVKLIGFMQNDNRYVPYELEDFAEWLSNENFKHNKELIKEKCDA